MDANEAWRSAMAERRQLLADIGVAMLNSRFRLGPMKRWRILSTRPFAPMRASYATAWRAARPL